MAASVLLLRHTYFSIYNWILCFGWMQVLYFALKTLKESSYDHVYDAVEKPLQLVQTAALFEVIHSSVGLVRSPVSATLTQISSRMHLTWGILYSFPEIIRYSFFGMKEVFGFAPSCLQWLRYSTFLLLYPSGIVSEVGLVYIALPYIKDSEKFCLRMPNKWNFSFDNYYGTLVTLGIYVLGFPHMFNYMLGQRKKVLSRSKQD